MQICLFFLREIREGPHDRLVIGADQKILDWLVKITFLGKVKTASQVLSLDLASWALAQVASFGACDFLFNR